MITLLPGENPNTNNLFSGYDSKMLLRKHLKTQPTNWEYRNCTIEYKHNSQGYRTYEFNQVDWNNAIVILGCSNVYGVGVKNQFTISKYLEKMSKRQVVNLGIGGSSIEFSVFNSSIIKKNNIIPYAIVQIWTGMERFFDNILSTNGTEIHHILPSSREFPRNKTYKPKSEILVDIDRLLWVNITKYYECTFFESTHKNLNVDLLEYHDCARDLSHPGKTSNKIAAEKIYKELEK